MAQVGSKDLNVGTSSVVISVAGLWTGEYEDRRPLEALDDDENSHIHGRLEILVAGRPLPRLGYFGPDDVCLNTWVEELVGARLALLEANSEYVFDEGEQGQPAYVFRRVGKQVLVSVRDSALSGAPGDPEWQDTPCDVQEFLEAVDGFLERMAAEVCRLGEVGERWLAIARGMQGLPMSD